MNLIRFSIAISIISSPKCDPPMVNAGVILSKLLRSISRKVQPTSERVVVLKKNLDHFCNEKVPVSQEGPHVGAFPDHGIEGP